MSLQNTWPLNLGGITAMQTDAEVELPRTLLDDRLSVESNSGWSPISTTIGLADDRVTARGFGPNRDQVLLPIHQYPWMNDRFAGKLSLNAFLWHAERLEREKRGRLCFGWFIHRRSSWELVDKFWTTGKMVGSRLGREFNLSTNARPIPSISIDRRVPGAF